MVNYRNSRLSLLNRVNCANGPRQSRHPLAIWPTVDQPVSPSKWVTTCLLAETRQCLAL